MAQYIKAARLADIPAGAGLTVALNGKAIALFNVGGKVEAVSDACLHQGGPLGEGTLEGCIVACPWHHWQYDVVTGACKTKPGMTLTQYAVTVEGDDVLVEV